MSKGITVLSLFDGISCGRVALDRASIKVDKYIASEIDKDAIKVSSSNWPSIIHSGCVTKLNSKNLPKIDMIIGGSPCQGFSVSGNQLALNDSRSKLFLDYVRLLNECKPKYFLLENVKMKIEFVDLISKYLGVKPIEINSSLVSAQNRVRLYWTNIPGVTQPIDKKILLKDIIDNNGPYEYVHEDCYKNGKIRGTFWQYDCSNRGHESQGYRAYFLNSKIGCLNHSAPSMSKIMTDSGVRKTTRLEHERLQNIPDGYTSSVALNKAKSLLGNGWTVDIISHIFSFLPGNWKK